MRHSPGERKMLDALLTVWESGLVGTHVNITRKGEKNGGIAYESNREGKQAAFLQFVYAPAREMRDCKGNTPLPLGFQ